MSEGRTQMDIGFKDLNHELQRIRQFLQEGGNLSEEEREMLKASLITLLADLDLHLNGAKGRKPH